MSESINKDTHDKGLVLVNLDYAKLVEEKGKEAANANAQQVNKASRANVDSTEETEAHLEKQRRQESAPSKSNEAQGAAREKTEAEAKVQYDARLEAYFASMMSRGDR